MSLLGSDKSMFDKVDTGDLRAVYTMAVSTIGRTHRVDDQVTRRLATFVFNAYVTAEFPASPLSAAQIEDMAALSVETMLRAHPDRFALKQ